MAYANADDYALYGDGSIPTGQLDKALERASDQIDRLTYNRIVARGIDNLSPFQRSNVIKAVCQQADFTVKYGAFLDVPFASFGAGSISMGFDKDASVTGGVRTSDAVLDLLRPTGLSNRGFC